MRIYSALIQYTFIKARPMKALTSSTSENLNSAAPLSRYSRHQQHQSGPSSRACVNTHLPPCVRAAALSKSSCPGPCDPGPCWSDRTPHWIPTRQTGTPEHPHPPHIFTLPSAHFTFSALWWLRQLMQPELNESALLHRRHWIQS